MSKVLTDFPAGAIENGRILADRLEHHYNFECEGGPLRNCVEWQEFRRCFEHLVEYAAQEQNAAAPQDFEAWFQSQYPLYDRSGRDTSLKHKLRECWTVAVKNAAAPLATSDPEAHRQDIADHEAEAAAPLAPGLLRAADYCLERAVGQYYEQARTLTEVAAELRRAAGEGG